MANLTVKMTKKDVFLLYALIICVFLFVFINYIYMPFVDKSDELDISIEEAQTKKLYMQMTISRYKATEREYEENTENLKKLLGDIFPLMEGYEIDWFFTQLIKSFSLEPVLFSVSEKPEFLTITPYVNSTLSSNYTNISTQDIYVSNVTLRVSGNRDILEAFLDHLINEQSSMRVKSYNYEKKDGEYLSITIDFYMSQYSLGEAD